MGRLEEVERNHRVQIGRVADKKIVQLLSEISITLAMMADKMAEADPVMVPRIKVTYDTDEIYINNFSGNITSVEDPEPIEERAKHDWISIEDGLPECGEDVISESLLLTIANEHYPVIGWYHDFPDGGGAFFDNKSRDTLANRGRFVSAWRYLPERYREDE